MSAPASASARARELHELLKAFGWTSEVKGSIVRASQRSFEAAENVFLAGQARTMNRDLLVLHRPSHVVVEDTAKPALVEDIREMASSVPGTPRVTTLTRIVDQIWRAEDACSRAIADAEAMSELPLIASRSHAAKAPHLRHVGQMLSCNGERVPDHMLFDEALPANGSALAVIADAGLGKTELLKWLAWRYATLYRAQSSNPRNTLLPPIALRVPLRGEHELTFDSISASLQTGEGGCERLPAITGGPALLHLLRLGRIILLLDGLDELALPASLLQDRLVRLRQATITGARIVVATREGHFRSSVSINSRFDNSEIARLLPLDEQRARELLELHGFHSSEQAASYLPENVRGIPLFLLLAAFTQLEGDGPLSDSSPASVLLRLIEAFCDREEGRLGLSGAEQVEMLSSLALWISSLGPIGVEDAMDILELDADGRGHQVVENPHALVRKEDDKISGFKYAQFEELFVANALATAWGDRSEEACSLLGERLLSSGSTDYLALLVSDERVKAAWLMAGLYPALRANRHLRRNLFAVALSKLKDRADAESPAVRAKLLAHILGNQDLSDIYLTDLAIQRVDLGGWKLLRLHGTGGAILYCENLVRAETDSSLRVLDSIEGSSMPDATDDSGRIAAGVDRLLGALKHFVNRVGHRVLGIKPKIWVAEALDFDACLILGRQGLLVQERAEGGNKFWKPTESGKVRLTKLIEVSDAGSTGGGLLELARTETWLRELLISLG